MIVFLMILVGSVFLGTEFFAIPTPFFQLTVYRALALSVIPIIIWNYILKNNYLIINPQSTSTHALVVYIIWYVWALISGMWTLDFMGWLQAIFLLTIGISSVVAICLWVNNIEEWYKLVKIVWIMMTLLVFWGFFEIFTNIYFFADLSKLDKYNTFITDPTTRIPITHFENQNDYATMLIAYLPVCIILYHKESHWIKKIVAMCSMALSLFLIYQTGSRMSLLSALLFFLILFSLKFKIHLSRKQVIYSIIFLLIASLLIPLIFPQLFHYIDVLIYTHSADFLTGDTARVNLLRNGLIFLATVGGLGLGAGNIEYWMDNFRIYPTNDIVNMHNWWGEILIAYGVIVFILYILIYMLLIHKLGMIRAHTDKHLKNIIDAIMAFLIAYIFASMTSSNNMLIEWHWVFFGLIIVFIKLIEQRKRGF